MYRLDSSHHHMVLEEVYNQLHLRRLNSHPYSHRKPSTHCQEYILYHHLNNQIHQQHILLEVLELRQ